MTPNGKFVQFGIVSTHPGQICADHYGDPPPDSQNTSHGRSQMKMPWGGGGRALHPRSYHGFSGLDDQTFRVSFGGSGVSISIAWMLVAKEITPTS